jgi:chitinase
MPTTGAGNAESASDPLAGGRPHYIVTDIGPVGDIANATVALGDSGIVVGVSDTTAGFEWIPQRPNGTIGHTVSVQVLGSPFAAPTGVNARGDIVGVFAAEDGQPHAFLIHNGKATDTGTLGGPSAVADAINNLGLVVGASETATGAIPRNRL